MKINKYVDGYTYHIDQIPESIRKYFDQDGIQCKPRIVGVHISKHATYAFLPHNTTKVELVSLKMIQDICKSIIIADNRYQNASLSNHFSSEVSDIYPIISWLINDYYTHGIYLHREVIIRKKDKGKIDWDKSIKKSKPLFLNNNPYIIDFFRKKKINQANIVSLVQTNVLQQISERYGLLFDNFSFKGNFRHLSLEKKSVSKLLLIQLRAKLKLTHILRDKVLIRYLIRYLETLHNNEGLSILTRDFHVIFEDAMKIYIHHDRKLQKYVPKAHWQIKINDNCYHLQNTQIPDGIVINDGKLNIYDAKYYDLSDYIHGTKTIFPPLDWYSVGKQFFYWKSFNRHAANVTSNGKNYFVFPYFPIEKNSTLKHIGNVQINIPNELLRIEVLVMDTFKVLEKYIDSGF